MTEPKPKLDRGRGSAKPETDDAMTSDLLKTAEKPQRTPAKSGAKSAKTGTGRPGKREQTKLNNEQAILGAAREVFAELGYGATTVRDIIRRTGLASGTFYNYFKSKEEVFEALMDEGMMRIRPRLEEARKRSNTFEEFIRNAYKAYFTYLADDLDHYRVIRRNSGALRVRMDTPVTMQGFEEIKAYIEDDIRDGTLAPVDSEYLMAAVVGLAMEIGDRMLLRGDADPDEAAEFATALVLAGYKGLPVEKK